MKIKHMTATFGRLQNETLELGPGLNLIQAPNEGGKSTWSAFLRAMLYGIPTKERDRQGFVAEKNRYQPWSGASMEGKMDIEWRGQAITLRRSQNRTVPFGKFEAVDTLTGEPIPSITGENAGEVLLGAPREVFERSAFVGQGAAAVDGSPALEKRISALVSSGEEDVSYSQVERQLRDWLNRRKHNKTGLIPKLEEETRNLEEALQRQEKAHHTAQEAQSSLDELQAERELLEQELAVHKYAAEESRRTAWNQAQSELEAVCAEEQRLQEELNRGGETPERDTLRRAQEELNEIRALERDIRAAEEQREQARAEAAEAAQAMQDPRFPEMTPEEARARAEQAVSEISRREREREKLPRGTLISATIGIVVGAGVAVAGVVLLPQHTLICAVGGGLLAVTVVFGTVLRERGRKKRLSAEVNGLLGRYGVGSPAEILHCAEEYASGWGRAQSARERLTEREAEQARLITQRESRKSRILSMVRTFAPTVRDEITISTALSKALFLREKLEQIVIRREGAEKLAQRLPQPQNMEGPPREITPRYDGTYTAVRLSAVGGEISRLSSVLAMARGELNTLGDLAVTQEQWERTQEELTDRRREYDAILLALEGLGEANRALQARFSPALNQRAGEHMAVLTGGKYDKITLTKEFEALAEERGSLLPRRVLTLSQGTADQLYLAVRLAVCELALPGEEAVPLVLDDVLANFDDGRMRLALDALCALAEERQILLFTCHSRESAYLSGADGVTLVPLHSGANERIMC